MMQRNGDWAYDPDESPCICSIMTQVSGETFPEKWQGVYS